MLQFIPRDRIKVQERDSYRHDECIHHDLGATGTKLYIGQHCILATSNDTESFCQSVAADPDWLPGASVSQWCPQITGPYIGWEEPSLPGDKYTRNIKDSAIKDLPKLTNWVKQQLGPESPLSCHSHTLPGPETFLTIIVAFHWPPQTNSFHTI